VSEERPLDGTASGEHPAAADALRRMFTRDFLYLAVSALQVILTALATPIMTRRLGANEYGQFALALTVSQILGPIFSFGLPFAAQKMFAEDDGDRRARGVLAISSVLAILAWVVAAVTAPQWGPAVGLYQVLDARLAAFWGALFALTWTSLAMLRSRERLGLAIFVAALQSLGAQGVGVALLYLRAPTLTNYLVGVIIGQGAAGFVGLLALRPRWSALAAIRRFRQAFAFGLPMIPQQLSGFILFAGDRIVVRHDLGSAATGRYSVAYNVGALGVTLLVFVNQAWMPRIYAVSDRALRSRLLASSRDMMNLVLIPVVLGLAAGAPVVLRLWAPPSFHPAKLTLVVAIVAIYAFPYGQFTCNLRALMSEGKTGRAALTTLIAAVVNIGLNIAIVPYIGITGSAIATVVSYILLARLTRQVRVGLQVPGVSFLLGTIITCTCAATLAMAAVPESHMWLDVRLAVCVVAAFALVFMMRRAVSGFDPSSRLMSQVAGAHRRRPGSPLPEAEPTPPVPEYEPLVFEYDTAMVGPDDITLVDALPPIVLPNRAGSAYRTGSAYRADTARPTGAKRRVRSVVLILVLVLALVGVADILVFHRGLGSRPAATGAPTATPGVVGHAQKTTPPSDPTAATTRASAVLVPVSASAFGPHGIGSGDNPQTADLAIDSKLSTAWTTDWYQTARFGGLQSGTGLLIDMGHQVRITRVRIALGSERGAALQLLTGNVPALASEQLQASASDAGGVVQLNLAKPESARYLLIWFTMLPPAPPGASQSTANLFQASVYNIKILGTP
jgi:O-antigen/teichoic acid export membrane protein